MAPYAEIAPKPENQNYRPAVQKTNQGEGLAMKVAVFSTKSYDEKFLNEANRTHSFTFLEPRLTHQTAPLASGHDAVCCFVNDDLSETVLQQLNHLGVKMVALRCAGYNNLDLDALESLGMKATRVPAYSPYAVAEHTLALILSANRKIHRAHNRVREMNFSLEGLIGFDLHGKTVGVIGTGKIGRIVCDILQGFGCEVLATDPFPNESCAAEYVELPELLSRSRIVTLHCPLTPDTHHFIDREALKLMQPGTVLVNTSRGALVNTPALIEALKSGTLGALALDVYEEEGDLFFEDLSADIITDDVFARLTTFPNVLITGHQAFFTQEALMNIAGTTMENLTAFEEGAELVNELRPVQR